MRFLEFKDEAGMLFFVREDRIKYIKSEFGKHYIFVKEYGLVCFTNDYRRLLTEIKECKIKKPDYIKINTGHSVYFIDKKDIIMIEPIVEKNNDLQSKIYLKSKVTVIVDMSMKILHNKLFKNSEANTI